MSLEILKKGNPRNINIFLKKYSINITGIYLILLVVIVRLKIHI